MAIKYKRPSRINIVSFTLLLGALAGLYAVAQFGPVYYRRWKAAAAVTDIANKLYAFRMRPAAGDLDPQTMLRKDLLDQFREIGIDETTVRSNLQQSSSSARVQVTYTEVVRHPLLDKTTTMVFTLDQEVR